MATSHLALVSILILHFLGSSSPAKIPPNNNINTKFIKTSCTTTLYPGLCYRSLSIYAAKIKTSPRLLAITSLILTHKATRSTSRLLRKTSRLHGLRPIEASAIADCVEVVGDSVDELKKSIDEMWHTRRSNFDMVMSDIQTWVSAALTDDSTCMDEMGMYLKTINGGLKVVLRKHVLRIAHMTSNALALVNAYAASHQSLRS